MTAIEHGFLGSRFFVLTMSLSCVRVIIVDCAHYPTEVKLVTLKGIISLFNVYCQAKNLKDGARNAAWRLIGKQIDSCKTANDMPTLFSEFDRIIDESHPHTTTLPNACVCMMTRWGFLALMLGLDDLSSCEAFRDNMEELDELVRGFCSKHEIRLQSEAEFHPGDESEIFRRLIEDLDLENLDQGGK